MRWRWQVFLVLASFVIALGWQMASAWPEPPSELDKPTAQRFCVCDSDDPKAFKVLFVGNSLLFSSRLPYQFADIYRQRGGSRPLKLWQVVVSAQTLTGHVRTGDVRNVLRYKGPFDVVILQGATVESIKDPGSLSVAAKELVEMARANGARSYLFLPWARNGANADALQKRISELYVKLGRELKTPVIPDGDLLFVARKKFPGLQFFDKDDYHPGSLGSYFGALLTYYFLTNDLPEGVSRTVMSPDGKVVLTSVSESGYSACMDLLKNYKKENPPPDQ